MLEISLFSSVVALFALRIFVPIIVLLVVGSLISYLQRRLRLQQSTTARH